MTTAQEYRQYAEECLRWARTAKSDVERTQFLEMANVWVQAGVNEGWRAADCAEHKRIQTTNSIIIRPPR